jgi:thiamine-phosphate pyrophosphorylase
VNVPFQLPLRCLITRGDLTADNFPQRKHEIIETIRGAVGSGIELVQIREKELPAKFIFELTAAAVNTAQDSLTRILVNDRLDIAIAAGADGVHMTGTSIPTGIVRKSVPVDFLVGVSTHLLDETIAAQDNGADFAIYGPVFETPGKRKATSVEKLAEICRAVDPFPVIAVGGIDASNYESVLSSGAAGFAAIRYLNDFVKMK